MNDYFADLADGARPYEGVQVVRRFSAVAAVMAAVLALSGAAAYAHVSISPGEAPKGGFAALSFRVPNEQESGDTVKLEVQFPADHPIAEVSTKPMPGWDVSVEKKKLDKPIKSDEGDTITDAVSLITWEGGAVKPGEFDDFTVSAGPLPDDVDQIVFKVIQTYSDGTEVSWIDETPASGQEPEHPAPVLTLTDAAGGGTTETTTAALGDDAQAVSPIRVSAVQDDADSANSKATIGIVIGALGLIAGLAGVAFALRKRPTT